MKPRFAKMKLVKLMLLLLWFGAFINAQSKEPFRESKNLSSTTTMTRVRSSVVVGIVNSSRTSQPRATSKMSSIKTQVTVTMENSLSVKATKASSNSSMTATLATLVPPTEGPMRGEDSNLGLIIAYVVAGIVVLVLVLSLLYYVKHRLIRRKCANRREVDCCDESPVQMNLGADTSLSGESVLATDVFNYFPSQPSSIERWRPEIHRPKSIAQTQYEITLPLCLPRSRCGRSIDAISSAVAAADRAVFYNDIAEDDTDITFSAKERLTRNKSTRPGLAKEMITTKGGLIQIDDIILTIGEGCLKQDTEITLIKDDQNYDFKSLLELGLLDAPPRVVEFLPDGLNFLKPADLRIRFEKPVNDSELFVLHGSYNRDYQRCVWELVTNDIEENRVEGFVEMKIHGFSFYSYIFARRGRIARILSHLNHSFSCSAFVLYRRVPPSTPTSAIDVAVVICSEFVEKDGEIEQVNRLIANGYTKGEKGTIKLVHTDRRLEMFVNFSGVETSDFQFKIDLRLLDSVGYVIDHFMGITKEKPVSGEVKINKIKRNQERKHLWTLRFCEVEEESKVETVQALSTAPDPSEEPTPDVVRRSRMLSNPEISRVSRMVGMDWDSLAGLMDIPYTEREEIRFNATKYPDSFSRAGRILELFNGSENFSRHILKKYFEELGRDDLKKEITFEEDEQATLPSPDDVRDSAHLRNTQLSSRETYRLSRRIAVDWDSLAGLMDIAQGERDNIRHSAMYNDDRSRAEKILSIFNVREDFSRDKLAHCLEGIEKLEWIEPIMSGAWRSL